MARIRERIFCNMNIYVGNLPYDLTKDELQDVFQQYGEVSSVNIITDKMTGRSKGFGFIEMPEASSAKEAISKVDGFSFKGRNLKVSEARPREERSDRNNDRRPRRPRPY
jgi:RNA recognition motif-containing protein